jgi:hypothetical protein
VVESARSAEVVLTPGFPLYHPDHSWVTKQVLERGVPGVRVGLYVEQPYASLRLLGRGNRTWTQPGLTAWRSLKNATQIVFRTPGGRERLQPTVPDWLTDVLDENVGWLRVSSRPDDWRNKYRAARAYASQLRGFGPLVLPRIALYEAAWGGECVAWLH